MTTRFADQSHRTKVSFPAQTTKAGEIKTLKISQLDFDQIGDISSKSLEEIEQEVNGKPKEDKPKTQVKIEAGLTPQDSYALNKIEKLIQETEKQIDLLESESRFKRGIIRRNLLWLEERLASHPNEFVTEKHKKAPESFRQLIETRFKNHYNSIDTEFRAARVERDLEVAPGTFSFHTLKPLFFARVYQAHGSITSTKENRLFKRVYGSFKDEEAFQLQLKAFLLACKLANVSERENYRGRGDTKKYKSSEFNKINPQHIKLAVRTIKKDLGLNSNPRIPKKSYTIRESELLAKCQQLESELENWKELVVLLLTKPQQEI
ncbi:MAG TPA: hypothetical protein VIQ31_29050 [Phormidium sp.]